MPLYRRSTLLLLLLLAVTAVRAEDAAVVASRSPGDLSDQERALMMQSANDYNACVFKQAMAEAKAKKDGDIRHIADVAMGLCQSGLDELKASIASWGFEDYFAEGFTRTVRDRAAHKLLPELAVELGR